MGESSTSNTRCGCAAARAVSPAGAAGCRRVRSAAQPGCIRSTSAPRCAAATCAIGRSHRCRHRSAAPPGHAANALRATVAQVAVGGFEFFRPAQHHGLDRYGSVLCLRQHAVALRAEAGAITSQPRWPSSIANARRRVVSLTTSTDFMPLPSLDVSPWPAARHRTPALQRGVDAVSQQALETPAGQIDAGDRAKVGQEEVDEHPRHAISSTSPTGCRHHRASARSPRPSGGAARPPSRRWPCRRKAPDGTG